MFVLFLVKFQFPIFVANIDVENPRYRGGSIPSKIFKVLDNSGKNFSYYSGGGGGGLLIMMIIMSKNMLAFFFNLLSKRRVNKKKMYFSLSDSLT